MTGPHRLAQPTVLDCEVLVIGSGPGGATVADVLTGANTDVIMLDEGPYVDYRSAPVRTTEALKRLWRCGGLTAALGPTPIAYAEGRCVGGGSEINSAIIQRAPEQLLERWAREYHIADFGADGLRPFYERVERAVNASVMPEPLGAPSEILRRAGETMGWEVSPMQRAQRGCVGTNMCANACPTGGKQSMTATLIPRAVARGLRLIAECRVIRLVRKGRRVIAVKALATRHDGAQHRVTIRADQFFLCAGAIHTPALLRRSGFRRNVGRTLRLHPTIKVLAFFDDLVDAHLSRLPLYAITEFMPDQRLGGSLFSPGFLAMSLAEDWPRMHPLMEKWRYTAMYYAMARGSGTGTVRPLPGVAEPLVSYALSAEDWRNLAVGVARLGQALFAAGAKSVYPSITGHPGWSSPDDCVKFPSGRLPRRRMNLMTVHLFSSCPPGEDRSRCATDSFGRVHGVENLIVADASQIPEAPGVNPQATVMALSYRAADAYLGRATSEAKRAKRLDESAA